jgi:hypothetical protein
MMRWEWPGRAKTRRREMEDEEKKQEKNQPEAMPTLEDAKKIVRRRGGKRKIAFAMPPMAVPVRGLLMTAPWEEQEKAHKLATLVLETWLGKKTRAQAAAEIGVPVVRMKQISDAALSGMVAGLLKQPKKMPKEGMPPEDNPTLLKKRILDLEEERAILQELVDLLKNLPANRAITGSPKDPRDEGKRKKGKNARTAGGSQKPAKDTGGT